MTTIRLSLVTLSIHLLAGCGGAPAGDTPLGAVTRADFGADWPFAGVDSGALRCELGSAVVFRAPDGTDYAINASARGIALREWHDGADLLSAGQTPGDLQPLIDRGLELCDG